MNQNKYIIYVCFMKKQWAFWCEWLPRLQTPDMT